MIWRQLYQNAHEENFKREYPAAYRDGHYAAPKFPDPSTTNGLTQIVQKFLQWNGHYANRINVAGRMIGGYTRTAAGNIFDDRKWIKSSTRRGSSDLMCSISGHMICIEIKNAATKVKNIGKDKRMQKHSRAYHPHLIPTNRPLIESCSTN